MSFNIEVQGGKNYLLPTGGKYCPEDIAISAIGGQTEGMYCWAKLDERPEIPIGYTKLESLTTTGVEYFNSGHLIDGNSYKELKIVADMAVSLSTANYRVSGTGSKSPIITIGINSSGKYDYGNGNTNISTGVTGDANRHTYTLDFVNKKYMVDSLVNVSFSPNSAAAEPRNFYISAYNTGSATDASFRHIETVYSYKFYRSEVLVNSLMPCLDRSGTTCFYDEVTGDTIYATGGTPNAGASLGKTNAKGFVLSDNENEYPADGYGEDGFYYKRLIDDIPWYESGSYVWAKSDAGGNLIEYVVSDNPSEFPEDGQGDDGYYYKLQEMGVSFKYASGSGSTPSSSYDGASFVVSGVAFRPKTIFLTWNATGQVNNTIVADFNGTIKQTNSLNGSTIAITDDGFTFFTNSGLYPSNTLSYSWMATGI